MNTQAGVSLIEVLVAVLVLAIGLLGIAGLQTAALTTNTISYQYTQAAMLAESMGERMRANDSAVSSGYYQLTAGTPPSAGTNCSSATCSPQAQANWDMAVLYAEVTGQTLANAPSLISTNTSSGGSAVQTLPSGNASIACPTSFPTNGSGTCVITIYWDATRSSNAGDFSCSGSTTALRCFTLAIQP